MPHTRKKSFNPKPSSLTTKLFFDVGSTLLIIQLESEKQTLNWKFYNVSEFKTKKLQRVRFLVKIFTTCQFLIENFYNASDFRLKTNTTR